MTTGPCRKDEDGFALLVVLAFLLLIATIAIPFFTLARQYALISRNVANQTRENVLAESLLRVAAQRYTERATSQGENPAEVDCSSSAGSTQMRFLFQDHKGLIDLNTASAELLQVGFQALGADSSSARQLARTVEAYRSPDTLKQTEDLSTRVSGGLKGAPFEHTEELIDFHLPQDVTKGVLNQVFTIHSGTGGLVADYASPRLRPFLERVPSRYIGDKAQAETYLNLTVEIARITRRGVPIHAWAIYSRGVGSANASRSGPVTYAQSSVGTNPPVPSNATLSCASFFDEGSQAILSELMQ